uniref:Uncharacterized protein n=1 Tax=Tanacetum cinerariifolium TaxID=118510 RepID=A0A699KH98_TANCI|nr:hypothetical protein [Tanacetum cinerariifolium]
MKETEVPSPSSEVLDLEKSKTAQAKEIANLKKRVKKLERKKKSRTLGLKRLWKVGSTTRVESSEDKESLSDQEDAFKQERMIDNIDQDAKDKGKGIMVEPKKPLKKKDQIAFDEEVARNLEARMKAEIEAKERIARKKDEGNIAVVEQWDEVQAKIDADIELAQKLQTEE